MEVMRSASVGLNFFCPGHLSYSLTMWTRQQEAELSQLWLIPQVGLLFPPGTFLMAYDKFPLGLGDSFEALK